MFRGGAAVAMPTTASTRPVGRLHLLSQPSGGLLQQTAGGSPLWRRASRLPDQQPPPPPPPTTNCELKQKWRAGLSHRSPRETEEPHKPEIQQNIPQWKRKQEQEKKPAEESERKVEPLWKRIREAEKKQELEKNQESETRRRPEPLWKKKLEPKRLEMKVEEQGKPGLLYTGKQEVPKTQEKNLDLPKLQDYQKIEPVKKFEPLWKRKMEPVKKPEPVVKENTVDKIEPKWKRKIITEPERKQEVEPKIEPAKKLEPNLPVKIEPTWKRKTIEPQVKKEPETKIESLKKPEPKLPLKIEPIWKRRTIEPQAKQQTETKQEPEKKPEPKKVEPIWKRKIETEDKQEPKSKQEPVVKKPEPLWKRKKEPEKEPEPKKPDPLGKKKLEEGKGKEKKGETDAKTERSTQDQPDEDDDEEEEDETEELLCPMCSELYDEEEHQPVLLPRCGHTFCRLCLTPIKGKGHFPCPTCRKRHLKPPIEELPVHKEILSRANAFREDKTGKCQTHHNLLVYWCRECQVPLCSACRVKTGHSVVRAKVVLQEKRQEMKERGQAVLDNVMDEKQKIIDTVRTCSVQLLKVCEESVAVDGSSQDVKEMLADTRQTADLSFVIRSLERMKSFLGVFGKAANDSESDENTTPKLRRRRERRPAQQSSDVNTNEKIVTPNLADNKKDFLTKQEKGVIGNPKVHKTTDLRATHQQPAVGGLRGAASPEVMRQGPLLSLADTSLWPLTCCVYTENGRRARLARQDGRLHMSALTENEEEAHFMIKLSVIQSVIPQDLPVVFLEVEAGERRLGRVYIKLWGHLRRAHHFLALCMGTHGPSYRGAKFEEVFSRGLKGECLHAGPYLTPSGDLSAQRVMDALEWDGPFKAPQTKGLVVGAGSGRPDRESCFDICTIENPKRDFACPFGEVVDGWDTIMAIIEYRPVRAVTMVDVGVVVPEGALHVT